MRTVPKNTLSKFRNTQSKFRIYPIPSHFVSRLSHDQMEQLIY